MFLNRLKKKKKTTFGKDSLILTISKIISGVIQILITMIISKYRSLQEYGTYTQMLLVINLVTSVLMLGLPNSISFFLGRSKNKVDRQEFLSVYLTLNTILTILSGAILIVCIIPIQSYFNNSDIGSYWFFLAFFPWAYVTSSAIENLAVASNKTKFLIPFKLMHSLFSIGIAFLCYYVGLSFKTYIIFYLVSECSFSLLIYIFSFYLAGKIKISLNKNVIKKILIFSVPIGLASAVGTLNAEIDKFMIGRFLTTDQVAIYANASKELPFTVVSISITAALLPRLSSIFSNKDYLKGIELWGRSIVLSLSIISLFAFGCFAYSEDIIILLYGDKYLPGVNVFKIFSILLLFRATYWGIVLNSTGNTRFIFYSSLFSLVLNICLNLVFYMWLGMVGCAVSSLLSTVAISIVQLMYTSKITKIPINKIWPWKKIILILLINFSLCVVFVRLKGLINLDLVINSFWESLILGMLWAIIYVFVLRVTGIINKRMGDSD